MVLPAVPLLMKIVAFSLAKKGSLYVIARQYGIPRLYRRVLEVNRKVITDNDSRKYVRGKIEAAFRFPNTVYDTLKDTKVQKVASEFYDKVGSTIFKK